MQYTSPIKYIAVPIGTASGPEWRGVIARHADQGYKIYWCASVLAELAARANHGGLLSYANGEPKSALELCAELGVEAIWAEGVLFPALIRLGEIVQREDGAWVCTSSMVQRTIGWQSEQGVLALPAAQQSGRKSMFSRPLRASEYKRWQRTCTLPEGVRLRKTCPRLLKKDKTCPVLSGKCPICPLMSDNMSGNETGHFRTISAQDTEFTEISSVQKCDNIIEVKNKGQQQQQKEPDTSAAVLAAPLLHLPPTQEITDLIHSLPYEHQADALLVCQQEAAQPAGKLAALQQFATALAAGKAAGAGWLRQAIRKGWAAAPAALQRQEAQQRQQQQEQDAWDWWQGLDPPQQLLLAAEHHSRLLGVRGLSERRKALILFRLRDELQEAA